MSAQNIITSLKEKNKTLASCESITGGRIASSLTSVSGASKVFVAGVVAYSEHAKIHAAGVDVKEVHQTHGYSEKTAQMMAERVRSRNIADIGIATTGCAEGSNEFMKEGEVIFAIAQKNKDTLVWKKTFSGNREEVQQQATEHVLENILKVIS